MEISKMNDDEILKELKVRWDEVATRYSVNEEEREWVLKRLDKAVAYEKVLKEVMQMEIDDTYRMVKEARQVLES